MSILYLLNLCGVAAFSISGALKGLNHKLDILGVTILGVITATGGGVIRDVTLNIYPSIFHDSIAIFVAIFMALLAFLIGEHIHKRKNIIAYFDGVGLAIFCALGSEIAVQQADVSLSSIILTSVITGTGGGVIRDILVREIPFILNKDLYATLCIVGSILYYVLFLYTEINIVHRLYIVTILIFIIRVIAIRFELSLPKRNL